jgi:hypothetical protein
LFFALLSPTVTQAPFTAQEGIAREVAGQVEFLTACVTIEKIQTDP